jgi:hypothetical protein
MQMARRGHTNMRRSGLRRRLDRMGTRLRWMWLGFLGVFRKRR